jgi:hypothetical protein
MRKKNKDKIMRDAYKRLEEKDTNYILKHNLSEFKNLLPESKKSLLGSILLF